MFIVRFTTAYIFIAVIWQNIEMLAYGEIRDNLVDTVITIIVSIVIAVLLDREQHIRHENE